MHGLLKHKHIKEKKTWEYCHGRQAASLQQIMLTVNLFHFTLVKRQTFESEHLLPLLYPQWGAH